MKKSTPKKAGAPRKASVRSRKKPASKRKGPEPTALASRLSTKKTPPFEFVLEELASIDPIVKPMFGAYGVYHGDKIVLVLRDRESHPGDNGIWVATTHDHHASLRNEFPRLRSIACFGESGETGWQNYPAESPDFEEAALRLCGLVRRSDPRIGKTPKAKKPRKAKS